MQHQSNLREIPLNQETIFEGILIDVSHMQVRLPDGGLSLREIVHHNGGVAIVPVSDDGQVTLVRQHRIAVDEVTLEIPAGKRDSLSEDPLLAARRELEEECGLKSGRMELLTVMLPTPGYCNERLHIYLATELIPCKPHPDKDEFLSVETIPFAQAIQHVLNGELTDGKTALGLLLANHKLHQKP